MFYPMLNKTSVLCLYLICFNIHASELKPEDVLGDYRADPLFGEAAADTSVVVDVGRLQFSPDHITVPPESNVSFIFINSSRDNHLMVISRSLSDVESDSAFINSYLEHGVAQNGMPGGHNHSGNETSPEDASPMVKKSSERPTVFLKPGETKELMVRFVENENLSIGCIIDEHHKLGMKGTINSTPFW